MHAYGRLKLGRPENVHLIVVIAVSCPYSVSRAILHDTLLPSRLKMVPNFRAEIQNIRIIYRL